jgi:hypothetical protein
VKQLAVRFNVYCEYVRVVEQKGILGVVGQDDRSCKHRKVDKGREKRNRGSYRVWSLKNGYRRGLDKHMCAWPFHMPFTNGERAEEY